MKNLRGITIAVLIVVFFAQTPFFALVEAADWTQTSQSDFDAGIKTNVDTTSDPGNVTLIRAWTKYPMNPVLNVGSPGSWDDFWATYPTILYDGATYKMWYTGHDGTNDRIGYATSPDGITWAKSPANPVLNLGSVGSWDDTYVFCSTVLYEGATYKMWYSGGDGVNVRIGYATSPDGVSWTKFAGNPVINLGSPSSWDDYRVYCPTVVYDGITYKIWYSGNDVSNSRIGYATSPDGISWTKSGANPVVDLGPLDSWDDFFVYYPSVIYDGITYKMWYTGHDGSNDRIGYATSPDGITWTKNANNPVLDLGPPGSWEDIEVCCPFALYDITTYKMWYSGDDGSYNRIGYAVLSYPSSGSLTSTVFDSGATGTVWNFINWTEYLPPGTNITLATRSGNTPIPDVSWSPWSTEMWAETGSPITSPRSRYIQYRGTLTTTDYNVTPILSEVNINYALNTAQPPILASPPNDIWITDNTPTFTWISTDLEGDSQTGFTVQIDNDSSFTSIDYTSGDVDSGDPWWTPSLPIADGIWYWRVRIRDTYNLWSVYSDYWTIRIDITPPTIEAWEPGGSPFQTYTQGGLITVTWTASDNYLLPVNPINISYGVPLSGWTMLSMNEANDGTYLWDTTDVTCPGTYWMNLSVYDSIGQETYDWSNFSFEIECPPTYPPIIENVEAEPDLQIAGQEVTIFAEVTDEDTDVEDLTVNINIMKLDGTSLGNHSMTCDSTGECTYSSNFDIEGIYTFTIWANDPDDNWDYATGIFVIEPEPQEFNWKPIIALIFALILLHIGILVSYRRPVRFTGILGRDRVYTFLAGVLPFVIAEALTGIISLFTGLLSVPPIVGLGMIVDLIILIIGIISCIVISVKGTIPKSYEEGEQPSIPPPLQQTDK